MSRKSIFIKLKQSQNRQRRLDDAHDWADKWERDYITLIMELQDAIRDGATADQLQAIFGDLRGLNQPKFRALHNIIDELDTPTRELIK